MKDFRKLKVWQKAHALTLPIYKATRAFPKHELYGLTSQIQRAAASISTNIAEGCGKETDADPGCYFQISMGSSSELEYLLLLANDLRYFDSNTYTCLNDNLIEVRKMLNAFLKTLKLNRQPLKTIR